MGKESGAGGSDESTWQAARAGLVIIGMALVLFFIPVILTSFFIALFWYQAYIAGDFKSYRRMIWPVAITLLGFVYLFGIPGKLSNEIPGVAFSDFMDWTTSAVTFVLDIVIGIVPKKMATKIQQHGISVSGFRKYLWWIPFVSAAIFAALKYKSPEMKTGLYDFVLFLTTPFRKSASHPLKYLGLVVVFVIIAAGCAFPKWLTSLEVCVLALTAYYGLLNLARDGKLNVFSYFDIQLGNYFPKSKPKPNTIFVGRDKKNGSRVVISEKQLNHHVHIVGASGFGKSVLLSHILRNRVESGQGLLFIDLKADIETVCQITSIAKACGREGDLQLFNLSQSEISTPYNVLALGTANQLKDRIMGSLVWSEEFYKNEAQSFLLKILNVLVYLRDEENIPFDFHTLTNLLMDPGPWFIQLIGKIPSDKLEMIKETRDLASHCMKQDSKKSLSGLQSQLLNLAYSDFGVLVKASSTGINLFDAVQKKKIVFMMLDSRTYGESAHSLGKLILQDLKAMSAKVDREIPKENRIPFTVVVDEFADLATEDFIGFLDRARSSKIGVVVAHQEIADLDRISPEFTKRLMNSTSTTFAFLQKLPDSSELIAGISGTRKVEEVTEQAERSPFGFGDVKTGMKSIKVVDEFNIHPNVIRSLSVGECVVIEKYPQASSQIVRVREEERTDYLSIEGTKEILNRSKLIKEDHKPSKQAQSPPVSVVPLVPHDEGVRKAPLRSDVEIIDPKKGKEFEPPEW